METWGVLFQKVVSSEWWFYRECWFTWNLEEYCFRKWSPLSGDFTESVDLHGTLRSIASESGLQWVVTLQRVLIYMETWGVLFQKVVTSEQWLLQRVGLPYMEPWAVLLQKVVSGEWSHQDGLLSGGFLCQNDVCCMFKTVVLLHCLFPGPVYLLWLLLFYFGVCWFLTHFVLVNRTFMYDIVEIIIDSLWIYFP